MGDFASTAVSGVEVRGYRRGALSTDDWDQYVIPVEDKIFSYRGRAASFRTPGRAGTTGQKLMTMHNATASAVLVDIDHIHVDMACTVVKAVTVLPPLIRVSRITTLPTGGTAMTKSPEDTSLSSSASLTLLQDAQAEGTSSASAITATAVSTVTQEFAPRLITAAGYEPFDREVFLDSGMLTLRPLEGLLLELVYTLATQNPVTDMWSYGLRWTEYTRP